MLKLTDLTIGYSNHIVQQNINAHFQPGQLVCITGDNGSGKSTLLRTIAGIQKPLSGNVFINSFPQTNVANNTSHSNLKLSTLVSLVPTFRPHTLNLTVREVVAMGRSPYTGVFGNLSVIDHQIVDQSIRQVDIFNLADKKLPNLSDGEVQKVMIAKCLAQQTPLILMDEPTAFLDFKSKKQFYQLLRRLVDNDHKLILFTSHDLPLALEYSTNELKLKITSDLAKQDYE